MYLEELEISLTHTQQATGVHMREMRAPISYVQLLASELGVEHAIEANDILQVGIPGHPKLNCRACAPIG